MLHVVENGNGKQFAMKCVMVNIEADLKLAKQEMAVMVEGGGGGEGRERHSNVRCVPGCALCDVRMLVTFITYSYIYICCLPVPLQILQQFIVIHFMVI